jgi:hypothetical protein
VHAEAEVVRGLVEGGMGAGRHDHLRLGDASLLSRPLAGGLHGAEDALGATRRHEAGDVVVTVQEVGGDAHDVALDAPEARERLGVEGVVVEEHLGDLLHDRVRFGSRVVDQPEGLAVLPAHVAGAQLGEGVDDLGPAHPGRRQRHGRHATEDGYGAADGGLRRGGRSGGNDRGSHGLTA